ncbi:MAG: hypothetical protein MMC23_006700 [Stictis urceolatum]|nr:hypothetical protein [Stictis urceolata]
MDRALDEVIGERQKENRVRGTGGGGRARRRENWPREGARKNGADRSNIDECAQTKMAGGTVGLYSAAIGYTTSMKTTMRDVDLDALPEIEAFAAVNLQSETMEQSAKLRVENLHYDLTEDDLSDLFESIAPITNLTLTYDRAGRSTGTAYVSYRSLASARSAIREFDGANANGQPIRLSLVPSGPSGGRGGRNPFDSITKPGRSLFDRIEGGSRGRDRSRSPRRSDVTKPPPEGIDRYVPGERSRSPPPRRRREDRGDRRGDRNDSRRGDRSRRGGRREEGGRPLVQGRPRMTQEELDKDMDSYWTSKKEDEAAGAAPSASAPAASAAPPMDDDIDMAE